MCWKTFYALIELILCANGTLCSISDNDIIMLIIFYTIMYTDVIIISCYYNIDVIIILMLLL